jgi:RNase H-fold protein (predicted Holliday junction resolvase)
MSKKMENSPKVLGLDVSTKTIGWALFDIQTRELLELTHVSPVIKKKDITKIEELLLKTEIFKTKLEQYKNLGITKVVIEEPLLNSNNAYTVGVLLRFNTLIAKEIFDTIGIVPEFISTYESRKNAYPELVRDNGNGKYVLFGGYSKTVDKKVIIWEHVAKKEPQIIWSYTKKNTMKKENYDMCDAYTCVLGHMRTQKIW